MLKPLLILVVTMCVLGCSPEPESTHADEPRLEKMWQAPAFKLTNQFGQPFGSEQVAGKPWIATLFFTTCPGPCPMMAKRLQEIQAAVNHPDLRIVSFSVDPDIDTVAKLKEYAEAHDADPNRWFFLTGKWDDVHAVARGFKLDFDKRDPQTNEISHSTQFLLVDKSGWVRGIYSHDDAEEIKRLKEDAVTLAKEG